MDFRLEISGWYQSPSVWGGNFKTDALWSMEAGMQKKILNGQGNIRLAVSDIFESSHWTGENSFGALAITANGGWESRRLRASFSYSFGNSEVKDSRKRETGLEEENSRLGSSQQG